MRGEVTMRKIDDLKPHPDQDAVFGDVSDAELQALADDIERRGLQQAAEVTPAGVIIDGHQRVRAYRLLGRETIEVVVVEGLSPTEVKERFIEANLNRRQLDPVAKARAIKALAEIEYRRRGQRLDVEHDGDFRDCLARRLGGRMSGRSLGRYLGLLKLPKVVQDAVSQGTLPMTLALRFHGLSPKRQREAVDCVERGESPRRYFATPPVEDNGDDSPAQRYRELIAFLEANLDELQRCAEEVVGTAGRHADVARVLSRATQLCIELQELEIRAEDAAVEGMRDEIARRFE